MAISSTNTMNSLKFLLNSFPSKLHENFLNDFKNIKLIENTYDKKVGIINILKPVVLDISVLIDEVDLYNDYLPNKFLTLSESQFLITYSEWIIVIEANPEECLTFLEKIFENQHWSVEYIIGLNSNLIIYNTELHGTHSNF